MSTKTILRLDLDLQFATCILKKCVTLSVLFNCQYMCVTLFG
jgi:hypothetical protein